MVIENMEVEIFRGKKAARKRTPISFYNKLITEVTGDNLKVQSKHEKKNCFFLFVGARCEWNVAQMSRFTCFAID